MSYTARSLPNHACHNSPARKTSKNLLCVTFVLDSYKSHVYYGTWLFALYWEGVVKGKERGTDGVLVVSVVVLGRHVAPADSGHLLPDASLPAGFGPDHARGE